LEITEKLRSSRLENEYVTELRGISRVADVSDGYLYRAENMSNKAYPYLSVRGRRAVVRPLTSCDGFYGGDTLIWVEGGRLFFGGSEVEGIYLSSGRKKILRLGSYVLIFPDGIYWNISDPTDYGNLSASYVSESAVNVSMVDDEGKTLNDFYIVTKLPDRAANGELCALVSGDDTPVIKRFDGHSFKTVKTYVKLEADRIGVGFQVGDTAQCTGLAKYVGDHFTVARKEANALYCEGVILSGGQAEDVSITRLMPYYDQLTVSGNRLYALRRGYDRSGCFVSRVYASAKGDPKNWSVYGGGMQADCDLRDGFTAICDYLGMPVAFTENSLAEIREKNGEMLITSVVGNGVEKGAAESCQTIGYRLYYKGRNGVYSYDGSYPKCISAGLESGLEITPEGAPGAAYNGYYYIKLSDAKGKEAIYIYNSFDKLWQREDDPGVVSFAVRGGNLYAAFDAPESENEKCGLMLFGYDDANDEAKSYCSALGYPVPEGQISWYCESGKLGLEELVGMYPVRLTVRVNVRDGGDMAVSLLYDDSETAEKAVSIPKRTAGAVTVPVDIKKCDTVRIRFSGHGSCEIMGYGLTYRNGGEIRGWR